MCHIQVKFGAVESILMNAIAKWFANMPAEDRKTSGQSGAYCIDEGKV